MAPQKQISPLAWLGLIVMGLCWGGSFVSMELMLRDMSFETLVALRVGGGAVFLWLYVFLSGQKIPKEAKLWFAFLWIGLLNVVMPYSLISWGQVHITSSLASILNATTALFGPLVAAFLFKDERLGARKATGVLLGFVGVVTVIGFEALQSFDLTSAGQLALIGASICYAFGVASMRVHFADITPEVGAAGMMLGAAVWMVPVSLITQGFPTFSAFQPSTFVAWGYVALISTGLAYVILFKVVKAAGSGNTSLVTLLVVPVAIVLGAVLLKESLPTRAFVGFGIIALALSIIDGRLYKRLSKGRRKQGLQTGATNRDLKHP